MSCRCGQVYLPDGVLRERVGNSKIVHTRESCRIADASPVQCDCNNCDAAGIDDGDKDA